MMEFITTIVKPAPSWIGRVVDLGPIDQIAPRCYMNGLFCFRLPPGTHAAPLFKRLQRMTFLSVQEIPQLATIVVPRNNDREELDLHYHEDKGAHLIFKDYTAEQCKHEWEHGTFDDLAKDHFPYEKLKRHTMMGALIAVNEKGVLPALMIQANLIPGGLVLVIALHHTVCDAMGYFMCTSVLAKHCRDTLNLEANDLSIDFTDRPALITPDQNASLKDLPDWRLVKTGEEFLNPTRYEVEKLPQFRCAVYYITEARLSKLRASLTAGGRRPSVVEAISALLWLHVVRARNIDTERYPEAKLSLTVNLRTYMTDPVIAPSYFGNMCEPNAVARMPTANFHADDFLPAAAQRIRNSISSVDAKAVRHLVGLLAQLPKATSITWNVDRWPGPDMLIACLQTMPVNALDFGAELGGFSEAFRPQLGDIEQKPDGRCIILPPRKEDGANLEIMLQYEASTLECLDNDQEFIKWFEKRN